MPEMSDTELVKSIRKGDIRAAYFFWGKDTASVGAMTAKLADKLCPPDERDLNYHFFPGASFSVSEFLDVAQSLPMFSDRVVAVVNDFNAETVRQDDMKLLLNAVSELDPETTTVIFYATGTDLTGGKKTLSPKNKKLSDQISKAGGISVEFPFKKPNELIRYIQSKLGADGCVISPENAEYLAALLGCNILMIDSECAKISSYLGAVTEDASGDGNASKEADSDVIALLVSDQIETDAYKLSRAVVSGKRSEAFKILDKLYSRQSEPIALLSVISGGMMDLYRAKIAAAGRKSESDVVSDFNYRGRDFAVRNAFRDSRSMPIEKLRYSLNVLSDCDRDMKSKRTDPKVMLETAITKILTYKAD